MQAQEITEAIKNYMQCDAIGLQALVLHGEWGSGKTYYCENDLKAALKGIDVKTCRVSLFGVSDYDEVLNRVIASCLPLSDKVAHGVGAAISALVKNTIKAGSSILSEKNRRPWNSVNSKTRFVTAFTRHEDSSRDF